MRRAPANLIEEWHDREIVPGADWNTEISTRLDDTDLFLVLLSPAFLASEYCQGVEMERAFERVKKALARLVPILIRPCFWKVSTLSTLQIVPPGDHAITTAPSSDAAYKLVA